MSFLHLMPALLIIPFLPYSFAQERMERRHISTLTVHAEIKRTPLLRKESISAVHCVQLCVNGAKCGASVFKLYNPDQSSKGSCLMYKLLTEKDIQKDPKKNETFIGWAYIIKKPWNCKEAHELSRPSKSGVYNLESVGRHYCKMDTKNCSSGGWMLTLKLNGEKNTFNYSSLYWVTSKTYNEEKCLANISSKEEGKFRAFGSLPFEKICLEMKVGSDIRGLEIPIRGKSLQQLFEADQYIPTHLGRNAWKTLISDSSLQVYCNHEGINGQSNAYKLRIGIQSNEYDFCIDNDSVIGIGASYTGVFSECQSTGGNCAYFSGDNGEKNIKALSYVYI